MGVVSEPEVFAVDGDSEFKEEEDEVVENDFVLFGRGWWRSLKKGYGLRRGGGRFNRGCRHSLRRSTHNSRSGSRSRRAPGCGTAFRGACAFGFGNGVSFFWVVIRLLGVEAVYLSSTASSVLVA